MDNPVSIEWLLLIIILELGIIIGLLIGRNR